MFDWFGESGESTSFDPPLDIHVQAFTLFQVLRANMAARPPHHKWTRAKVVIESTGRFHTDFSYEQGGDA